MNPGTRIRFKTNASMIAAQAANKTGKIEGPDPRGFNSDCFAVSVDDDEMNILSVKGCHVSHFDVMEASEPEVVETLEDAYRELRYQCWHNCTWENPDGEVDSSNDHLPPEGWKPFQCKRGCGFKSIGDDLKTVITKLYE